MQATTSTSDADGKAKKTRKGFAHICQIPELMWFTVKYLLFVFIIFVFFSLYLNTIQQQQGHFVDVNTKQVLGLYGRGTRSFHSRAIFSLLSSVFAPFFFFYHPCICAILTCSLSVLLFSFAERVVDNMMPDCCRGTDPQLAYDVTITDFSLHKERTVIVTKNSGDYIPLDSPTISFTTHTLLTDTDAENHIQHHFSQNNMEKLRHRGAIICLGEMTLTNVDFGDDITTDKDDNNNSHNTTTPPSLLGIWR